jgi:general secretion pathway protein N
MRWALTGLMGGVLLALLAFAPARWLAAGLASASAGRVQLAEAQGTVWRGSGVLLVTAGAQSREASALPGRLHWRTGVHGVLPVVRLSHACCIEGELSLLLDPGTQRTRLSLLAPASQGASPSAATSGSAATATTAARVAIGHWPASLLMGLGAPWNTLRINGTLHLAGQGLSLEFLPTGLALVGQADLSLTNAVSRVSALEPLGDYVLTVLGSPGAAATTLQLRTTRGALQLNGDGQWTAAKLRFNGQANAAPGFEAVLNNLLNILGRRQGALSVLSIG